MVLEVVMVLGVTMGVVEVVAAVVAVEAVCHVAGWWWRAARVCQIMDDATECQRVRRESGRGSDME